MKISCNTCNNCQGKFLYNLDRIRKDRMNLYRSKFQKTKTFLQEVKK